MASKKEGGKDQKKMSQAEIKEHFEHFEEIIYDNLLQVLENRYKNPVSKFAKMILEDAGLDKNGDIRDDIEQPPKRKDRKKLQMEDDGASHKMMKMQKKLACQKMQESDEEKP